MGGRGTCEEFDGDEGILLCVHTRSVRANNTSKDKLSSFEGGTCEADPRLETMALKFPIGISSVRTFSDCGSRELQTPKLGPGKLQIPQMACRSRASGRWQVAILQETFVNTLDPESAFSAPICMHGLLKTSSCPRCLLSILSTLVQIEARTSW